jgi:hypothetical protein
MARGERRAGSVAVRVSPDGTQRFYARRSKRWLIPAFTWFCAAIAVMGPAQEFGFYDTWQTGVPFVAAVVAGAGYLTYGAIRCGILVEPGWVTNRRILWARRVTAGDIAGFEPPPPYGTLRRTGIRIALRDGRVLSATAFARWKLDDDSMGVPECAELNAWLETQAEGTQVAPPLP